MSRTGMAGVGCALLAAVAMGGTAAAADSDAFMKVLYDNTLTCQGGAVNDNWLCYDWFYPGGYVREFQVLRRRDGNMVVSGRQGTYTLSDDATPKLCQSFDEGRHRWCRELAGHQVGDQWQETLATGEVQKYSLLKGRLLLNFLSGDGSDKHILAPYKYPDYPPDPSRRMRDIGGAASR